MMSIAKHFKHKQKDRNVIAENFNICNAACIGLELEGEGIYKPTRELMLKVVKVYQDLMMLYECGMIRTMVYTFHFG